MTGIYDNTVIVDNNLFRMYDYYKLGYQILIWLFYLMIMNLIKLLIILI